MNNKSTLMFVGPLGDFPSGRVVVSNFIHNIIKDKNVTSFNVVLPRHFPRIIAKTIKITRYIKSIIKILNGSKNNILYLVVEDGLGLYLNYFLLKLCRKQFKQIILHHHSAKYINNYVKIYALISKILIKVNSLQITQCDIMAKKLKETYNVDCDYLSLSNAFLVQKNKTKRNKSNLKNLGYMSTLTKSKGIVEAIKVFQKCFEIDSNFKFYIAGNIKEKKYFTIINELIKTYPRNVFYLGVIKNDKKRTFFDKIDFFLFPTNYITETEGIVTLESMSFGIPVISTDKMCIPRNLTNSGGVFYPNKVYVENAVKFIIETSRNEDNYKKISFSTITKFDYLKKKANDELMTVLNKMLLV